MLPILLLASLARSEADLLERKMTLGEKSVYEVRIDCKSKQRTYPSRVFRIGENGATYKAAFEVKKTKVDGIAEVSYRRYDCSTYLKPLGGMETQRTAEPGIIMAEFDLAPSNELLSFSFLSPQSELLRLSAQPGDMRNELSKIDSEINPLMTNLNRIFQWSSGVEQSIEFMPKLPLEPVKNGDSWRRTIGYFPQPLADENATINQRVDAVYTYVGRSASNNINIRMEANLQTDILKYVIPKASENILSSYEVKANMQVDFELNKDTFGVQSANGKSHIRIAVTTKSLDQPYQEKEIDVIVDSRLVSGSQAR